MLHWVIKTFDININQFHENLFYPTKKITILILYNFQKYIFG